MSQMDHSIRRRNSISTRLTLMVAGILVMVVLASGSLVLFEQQQQLNHALKTKATSLVQFMAQVTPLSILSLNFVEMNNNVKKVVLTDEDAVYAILLNEQGIPLVYFFKDTDPLITDQVRELFETRKALAATESLKQTGRILEITAPIFSGEKRIGSAILGLSLDQVRRALLSQIIIIGIFLVIIISLSIALLRLVLRQILHPVQMLTTAATQISTGDLNVVLTGTDRADELGILASAFKSMTDQLRESILGLEQNVAELKRTSQALRESEERFRAAFENANVGVCLVATDGQLLKVNNAMCQMFGYSHQEFEQMNINSIAHSNDLEVSPTFIKNAISGENNQANFDKRYFHKQGQIIWGHVSTSLIRDAQGEPLYFISHVQDVSAQKQAEEKIRKLNQELEQRVVERTVQLETANKELEAFAYSVSHDLRAPLRHIDGFLELLQKRMAPTLDVQSRHYMATITDSARHMGILIDDLLSFSRMGRSEMSTSPVDLNELVQNVIQEFKPETEGRDIQWQISALPVVTGDRAMLRIVLVNLISNALKFTRSRPQAKIEIGWMTDPETESIVYVRDNGVGFDMTYADKLFGVFQRLHRVDEFEGTGIGLANVRRIIYRHNGKVWAEGKTGCGATFYFSLPQPNRQG